MRGVGSWLRRRAENVAAAMLAVMFAAFVIQIVFRYFLNFPIGWTSELTVILWLWLVLWGAAFVVKESEEIRFDLLCMNLKLWNSLPAAKQKSTQAAVDKALKWSTDEHLKREGELAESFKKHGLEIYTPNVAAFRAHAQKVYLASDEAKEWPKGMVEKINALK